MSGCRRMKTGCRDGIFHLVLSTQYEVLRKLLPCRSLERLVQAFSGLEFRDLNLVLCGKWGWGFEKLQWIKNKNIIFTGYVNDEERQVLLENALVYVQPSITEGFGLPVLEAMAAAVPVASSSGGALAEVVNEAGELFNPLDTDDMRNKIERAM